MGNGTKFDKGKLRMAEMIVDFKEPLEQVCKVWEYGAKIHGVSKWKELDAPVTRYTNALVRHILAEKDNPIDAESQELHAAHIAWNALARLYFIMQRPVKRKPDLASAPAPKYKQLRLNFGTRED